MTNRGTGSSKSRGYRVDDPPRIALVVSGWPRLSETFAINEALALHARGMLAGIFATKEGNAAAVQPQGECLAPLVRVLAPGTVEEQAIEVAARMRGSSLDAVHGYFAHTPASVARESAARLGVPFGFSVHALDARKVTGEHLAEMAFAANVVVACNSEVRALLERSGVVPRMLAHGVDLNRFQPRPPPAGPTHELLAVGRLVEKKGFETLVRAMALLNAPARLRIVGDGGRRSVLEALAIELGVQSRIVFTGSKTHDELPAMYASADTVVVPSVIDSAGDRDGLPNVVLEAMASARPVVASDVAAIASAVIHGETGLLVASDDPVALAESIDWLAANPSGRDALGAAGRWRVERRFDLDQCGQQFCDVLARAYG